MAMGNIVEIQDFAAAELDVYARLTENQLVNREHPEEGLFIAEGHKIIAHALDAGLEPVSFLMEKKHLRGAGNKLMERCPGTPVYTAESEVLEKLTGYRMNRGLLCAMRRPAMKRAEEVCRGARRIAVLEGIVDPSNVGAIFRSAAALGMDAVLLAPNCCDALDRKAVRVSMGTVFQIPWAVIGGSTAEWLEKGADMIKELGFKTAALALDERAISIEDAALKREERLALLLGTEGDGLQEATVKACDYTVMIPMCHGVDSLNVAAAASVAFWELR